MTENNFNNLLNDIDDELIERADKAAEKIYINKVRKRVGWSFIAACLCLIILQLYGVVKYTPSIVDMFAKETELPTQVQTESNTQPVLPSHSFPPSKTDPVINPTREEESPSKCPTSLPTRAPSMPPTIEPSVDATETIEPASPTEDISNSPTPDNRVDHNDYLAESTMLILTILILAMLLLIAPVLLICGIVLLRKK